MEINSPNYSCPVIAEFTSSVGTAPHFAAFSINIWTPSQNVVFILPVERNKKGKKNDPSCSIFFSVLGFITNNFFTGQMPSSCLQWESGKLSPV